VAAVDALAPVVTPTVASRLGTNRWHYARQDSSVTACGRYVFNNPKINVTSDPAKTTCALCLKWLPPQRGEKA
jgi:hypothetical protein